MYGDDFSHPEAEKSYKLMDKIIGMMQDEKDITVKFSTIHDWLESIKEEAKRKNIKWPIYTYDLLPQLTDMTEYWSGYYTSQPFFKKVTRQFADFTNANSFLYSLEALRDGSNKIWSENAEDLFRVSTVNYHHDAITGTHFPRVTEGYMEMMKNAFSKVSGVLSDTLKGVAFAQGLDLEGSQQV